MNWDDFRAAAPVRLLLPLSYYNFGVSFVEFAFSEEQKAFLSQQLTGAIVEAIRMQPDPVLSAISFPRPSGDEFFIFHYGAPVYSFSVSMNNTSVSMQKSNCSIEDYILTLPLFADVARQLYGANSKYSLANADFFRWLHRTSHDYSLSVTCGQALTDDSKNRTNKEIISRFVDVEAGSVIADFNADAILRSDVDLSLRKNLGGRPANIWVTAAAPYSPTERDLSFTFSLRRGEAALGTVPQEADLFEFDMVAEAFYRDFVVARVLKPLFADTAVAARLK